MKRKITKQSLAELAKVMPVVPEWEMRFMVGGTGSNSGYPLYYGGTLPEVVCSVTIPSDLVALSEAVGGLQIIGQSLDAGGGNSTIGSNGKLYIPKDVLSRGFFGNQYVQTYKLTMIGGAISKIAGPVGNLITGYELIREIENGNIDGAILGLVGAIGAAAGASMGASVGAKIGAGIGGPSGALTGAAIGAITGGVLGAYTAEELYESIGGKTFLIF